jgi:hypothetical protein
MWCLLQVRRYIPTLAVGPAINDPGFLNAWGLGYHTLSAVVGPPLKPRSPPLSAHRHLVTRRQVQMHPAPSSPPEEAPAPART